MQPDTTTPPHLWLLLSNAITAILAVVTTLTTLRFRHKREPVELAKLQAETHSSRVVAEVSTQGMTLETLREIQLVIQKAESRREEWQRKEDQMRKQIVFWRNKAEEFDGQIIDLRYEVGQLETRYNMKKGDLEKALGLLHIKHISFSEADRPRED